MSQPDRAVLSFLSRRRSSPPRILTGPPPSRDEVIELLRIAARVPDHGKLAPWRFVVLEPATLDRLAPLLAEHVAASGGDEAAVEKARSALASPSVVAVVLSPVDSPKVPEWEQALSAGAVAMQLLNAALASGWGGAWLTGPAADPAFAGPHLGLAPHERVVALIHLGRAANPAPDRPRPDIAARTVFL